jgi:isoleucyl-tRNA synthetase
MYSTKLSTPISSFEVAMDDTYGDVNDMAITVAYDLSVNGEAWKNTYLLIRTTTPWTIPANMAAGVHKNIDYVKAEYNGKIYICARKRVEDVFKGKDYTIIDDIK